MKHLHIIFTVILTLLATACTSDEPTIKSTGRTVLVYMVADNSLGSNGYSTSDLAEMQRAAENGDITDGRLLVYLSAPGVNRNNPPVLAEMTPEGLKTIKTYADDPEVYSIDVDRMREVFDDMRRYSPANDYGLILWSHGLGWHETATSRSGVLRSFGDDRGKTMKISSLAKALDSQGFSFVYFDCCYMAGVEVAYELRNTTPYIVASATELPAEGMPYDRNVRYFFKQPADLTGAARSTFELFNSKSHPSDRTCTISVISTAGLDRLASATRDIMATGAKPLINRNSQQPFMLGSCSFYDFGRYITTLDCPAELLDPWQQALDDVIIYRASTERIWNTIDITYHSGLSTYPVYAKGDETYRGYENQSWWRDVVSHNPSFQ